MRITPAVQNNTNIVKVSKYDIMIIRRREKPEKQVLGCGQICMLIDEPVQGPHGTMTQR